MPWSLQQTAIQLWCCARASPGEHAPLTVGLAGSTRRNLTSIFGKDMVPICIEYEASGQDADEFDRVFHMRTFEAFARLLDSEERLDRFVEPKHPWAEDPRTVGALAAVQLALLASVAAYGDPEMKEEILSAGVTERLVAFLGADEPDRAQAAVIALSYLTDECSQNAHAIYEAGALPFLIKQLDSPVAGMRGAAASTLRHICMESEEYCKAFMDCGGLKGFVNQLDPHLDNADLMLEAVWNFEDVTTDADGNLIEHYAKLAAEQGAVERLEQMRKVGEEEVSSAVEKVLCSLLAQAKREG